MNRLLVMSDSHGDEAALREAVLWADAHMGRMDAYLHLGDGARDFARLENLMWQLNPAAVRLGVKGNCDLGCDLPLTQVLPLAGVRVLLTHGHPCGVKDGTALLAAAARENRCALALYGHTHLPKDDMAGEVRLVNPGSLRDGRFAVVKLSDQGEIEVQAVSLDGR